MGKAQSIFRVTRMVGAENAHTHYVDPFAVAGACRLLSRLCQLRAYRHYGNRRGLGASALHGGMLGSGIDVRRAGRAQPQAPLEIGASLHHSGSIIATNRRREPQRG